MLHNSENTLWKKKKKKKNSFQYIWCRAISELQNGIWIVGSEQCCWHLFPIAHYFDIHVITFPTLIHSIQGNQNVPPFAQVTSTSTCRLHAQNQQPWGSWTSPGYRTWTNKERKSCSTFWSLFAALEVKDDLYGACRKERNKTAITLYTGIYHPNALLGSATIGLLA